MFSTLFDDHSPDLRRKVTGAGLLLIAFNVLAWGWAFIAFRHYPLLMGTAVLAYSLGLRHAVDADHIAAIDNVTRKLMAQGKRPVSVGLFFSLGHSSVVVALSVALAFTATLLQGRFEHLKALGAVIGTGVSAFFLLAIAMANIFILRGIWRSFSAVRRGEKLVEEDLDLLLAGRGFMSRIFRGLFRLIDRSWHMYPLGFLFGLGFDTATEVGLLGVSAAGASQGLSMWSILVFPALFSAGMALVDTADGILVLGAYGWAFVKPVRKLYYNLTITVVSVLAALVVGGVETLGLLARTFRPEGAFWTLVERINDNMGLVGYLLIGIFIAGWLISFLIYRAQRIDEIEVSL